MSEYPSRLVEIIYHKSRVKLSTAECIAKAIEDAGYLRVEPVQRNCDTPLIVDGKIHKAIDKERERILQYLKGLLKANPKASLASVLDLIEMSKPGGN